jgi:hypothetical protein
MQFIANLPLSGHLSNLDNAYNTLQPILTFLTVNDQAEEAVTFYPSVFEHSAIKNAEDYVAMNGGPHFTFANGISLLVNCDTQPEVDRLGERVTSVFSGQNRTLTNIQAILPPDNNANIKTSGTDNPRWLHCWAQRRNGLAHL